MAILIADSGATKCEWCLVSSRKKTRVFFTQGISPYFQDAAQIEMIVKAELLGQFRKTAITELFFYGTGCASDANALLVQKALKAVFPGTKVKVTHDLMGAARSVCGHEKGIACILGTGSNSCYYNGKKIVSNSPGLGYVLGDEGSGAYLGRKVLQYYLYNTFDEELRYKFDLKYATNKAEILENVYKQSLPNRYLAGFSIFLSENRGHFMIENIIEDGLNDFFFTHLCKYGESWKNPIHFVGGISFAFRDVIAELCDSYEFELGRVMKHPMEGLIEFHTS